MGKEKKKKDVSAESSRCKKTDTVPKVRFCCDTCQGVGIGRCWENAGTTETVFGPVLSPVFSAEGISAPSNTK